MTVYLNNQPFESLITQPHSHAILEKESENIALAPKITVIKKNANDPVFIELLLKSRQILPPSLNSNLNESDEFPCNLDNVVYFIEGEGVLVCHDDPTIEGTITTSMETCTGLILYDKHGNYFQAHLSPNYNINWPEIFDWFKQQSKQTTENIELSLALYGNYFPSADNSNLEAIKVQYSSLMSYLLTMKSLIQANKQASYTNFDIHIKKQFRGIDNTFKVNERDFLPMLKDILVIKKDLSVIYEVSAYKLWRHIPALREFRNWLIEHHVMQEVDYADSKLILPEVKGILYATSKYELTYRNPFARAVPLTLVNQTVDNVPYEEIRNLFKTVQEYWQTKTKNVGILRFEEKFKSFVADQLKKNKTKILTENDFELFAKQDKGQWIKYSREEKSCQAKMIYYYKYLFTYNENIYSYLCDELRANKITSQNIALLSVICETFSDPIKRAEAYSMLGKFHHKEFANDKPVHYQLAQQALNQAKALDPTNPSISQSLTELNYSYLCQQFKAKQFTSENIAFLTQICEEFVEPNKKASAYSTLSSFYREKWLMENNESDLVSALESITQAKELDSQSASIQEKFTKLFSLHNSFTESAKKAEFHYGLSCYYYKTWQTQNKAIHYELALDNISKAEQFNKTPKITEEINKLHLAALPTGLNDTLFM